LIWENESDSVFFRIKKSGHRAYVQVVENKRFDGAARESVIANLGRADDLIASGALASLLASGAKHETFALAIGPLGILLRQRRNRHKTMFGLPHRALPPENQAPNKESHPIHQIQELPGSALRAYGP
jgi:hypothetical protein